MELRVLKYFLIVAREQNITKAAKILHITQPTLSRQLMALEDELGVTLFERGKHSLTLTNEGMMLKARAQDIVSIESKILEDFDNNSTMLTGTISIGCGESAGMDELSKVIASFSKKYPLVHFYIHSANSDTIKENIDKGIFDFGLLLEPVDISKYQFKRIHLKETWGCLVKDDHPLTKLNQVTKEDLKNYPLMIPGRTLVYNELNHWFSNQLDEYNIMIQYNIGYNLVHLIKNDVAVALCLDTINQMKGLTFIPLYPKLATNSLIVWKKNQLQNKLIQLFLEELDSIVEY